MCCRRYTLRIVDGTRFFRLYLCLPCVGMVVAFIDDADAEVDARINNNDVDACMINVCLFVCSGTNQMVGTCSISCFRPFPAVGA